MHPCGQSTRDEIQMSNSDGVGIGTLIGLSMGEMDARNRAHGDDLARMRQELLERSQSAFYQEAFKEAAGDVLGQIVDEIKGVENGSVKERRMSDPKNPDARNEAYAEAAAKAVTRLSDGRVNMSRLSMDRIKNARHYK